MSSLLGSRGPAQFLSVLSPPAPHSVPPHGPPRLPPGEQPWDRGCAWGSQGRAGAVPHGWAPVLGEAASRAVITAVACLAGNCLFSRREAGSCGRAGRALARANDSKAAN